MEGNKELTAKNVDLEKTWILYTFHIFYNKYCSVQASLFARNKYPSSCLKNKQTDLS